MLILTPVQAKTLAELITSKTGVDSFTLSAVPFALEVVIWFYNGSFQHYIIDKEGRVDRRRIS